MSDDAQNERRIVAVTGAGVLSPLADSLTGLHQALCAGRSAIGPSEILDSDAVTGRHAGEIRGFAPADYLGAGNLRPLDRTSRLAAVAAKLALGDAGWTPAEAHGDDGRDGDESVALVLGTMFGSIHTISAFDRRALEAGPRYAKPMDFANSVINAAAGQTAIWHRFEGINTTIAGDTTAGLAALAYASDLVASGRARRVLAGGAEELSLEAFLGFEKAGRLASAAGDPECRRAIPFDARRSGFALAEGAALLSLEPLDGAEASGAAVLATIAGHGSAFDPSRGERPAERAAALERAVRLALADAAIDSAEVDVVIASANGSPQGDRDEAAALAAVLDGRAGSVPVTSVKGSLGEALGASGALQAAALLATFASGRLPGIRGLGAADAGLGLDLSAETREIDARVGLLTALGLDGNAVAVVVRASE